MDEQEFYDELWNEFKDSDDRGTFTTWLINKMGFINVYIEKLRADLARARRAQGVPHATFAALERDNQRLRDQLENERREHGAAPAIGQPRPARVPNTGDNPYIRPHNPWTPGPGEVVDWPRTDDNTAVDWNRVRAAQNFDPRRGPDTVREPERVEALRRRIEQLQADAQGRNRRES